MRRPALAIARVLALAAVAALAWAAWLSVGSGFDTHIGRTHFTSRDAMSPLVVGLITLIAAAASGDCQRIRARLDAALSRVNFSVVAGAIVIGAAAIAFTYATGVAGGSDSYGYVSQANSWIARGSPLIPAAGIDAAPWPDAPETFAPLGYHATRQDDGWMLAPTYAPGVPLLMAAAKQLVSEQGPYLIGPLAGALLIWLTFLLGRLLYSPAVGVVAAWLLATSAMFFSAVIWPMSDIPAAAAWTAVFFLLQRRRRGDAIAAGLLATVAIAIRPNLILLTIACALPLVINARREARARGALIVYGLAALPAPLAVAWTNHVWYGAAARSAYGTLSYLFVWSRVLPNLRHYASWLVVAEWPLLAAALLAGILGAHLRSRARRDAALAAVAVLIALLVTYLPYLEFDHWSYLRFFLPAWPLAAIGAAALLVDLARQPRPFVAIAGMWLVLSTGLIDWRLSARLGVFRAWRGERRAVLVGQRLRDVTDPHSVIFSLIYSGSARYYGGCETIRYDLVDAAWLDRAVQWLSHHGAHPYLLAEWWEIPDVRARFPGQTTVTALDRPPVLTLEGDAPAYLIDLAPAAGAAPPTLTLPDSALDARDLRAAPPAPVPTIPWR